MNVGRKKKWLQGSACMIAAGALGMLTAGIMWPTAISADDASAVSIKPIVQTDVVRTREVPQVALQPLLEICQRDWRKPLSGDQTSVAEHLNSGQSAQQVFMNLRLLGTAIETGHSMAMFQKSDGTIGICGEGEQIEDGGSQVTVSRIAGTTVTVHGGGQTQVLAMPTAPGAGAGAGAEVPQ